MPMQPLPTPPTPGPLLTAIHQPAHPPRPRRETFLLSRASHHQHHDGCTLPPCRSPCPPPNVKGPSSDSGDITEHPRCNSVINGFSWSDQFSRRRTHPRHIDSRFRAPSPHRCLPARICTSRSPSPARRRYDTPDHQSIAPGPPPSTPPRLREVPSHRPGSSAIRELRARSPHHDTTHDSHQQPPFGSQPPSAHQQAQDTPTVAPPCHSDAWPPYSQIEESPQQKPQHHHQQQDRRSSSSTPTTFLDLPVFSTPLHYYSPARHSKFYTTYTPRSIPPR